MKLIMLEAHTGIEYVNPAHITHVSVMRGYMLIHLSNQAMLPVAPEEWTRVKPLLVEEQPPAPPAGDDYGGF